MEKSNIIYQKLELFIKKFYTNELIRGIIFFVGLGLIYLLFTLFVEYSLWLKPSARTILFYAFIIVELFLLGRFILFPLSKLFKLQKGIDYKEASNIIGNHFTEVSDKLTNFLQLSNDKNQSELLLASIVQKSKSLQPVPFQNAINFNKNKKYLPLAIIPILLFVVFYISGNVNILSQSLNRVVNYKQQFSPPAPFKFVVLNKDLQTEQNQDFIVKVKSKGNITPETAMIHIGEESYFMEKIKEGEFQYKFLKPTENIDFNIQANDVISNEYVLNVVTVPSIANFEMQLNFPGYLKKSFEVIKGNGNAIIPEGTQVTWRMKTQATQNVQWKDTISSYSFAKAENTFTLSKNITQNTEYQILTSNEKVKNYEKLNYQISVIKDQFPTINVDNAPDSLKVEKNYVLGKISDDYGLSKLQIVYYEKDKPNTAKRATLGSKKDVYDQFVFSFPSTLPVKEGVSYEFYFEVFDNDAIHNYKTTKSTVFSNRITTDVEKQDQILQQQNENISGLQKSLKAQDKQMSELDKLQKTNKEKDNLEFKDQQKINDFIKKQEQQDEMMKQFAEKMKDNLDKFKSEKKDELKEELEKRLEKSKEELEKNKKLLDELKELNDKLKQDELTEKLDKFKKESKNQSKNLEQLVELTKRYYVKEKAEQIFDKLDKLSDKQEELSNKDKENTEQKQNEINKEFDEIQKELKEVDKENKELKKPMNLDASPEKQKEIDEDLKKASDDLKIDSKESKDSAKKKQKSAAKKMKEMSTKAEQEMEGGEQEQLDEDVAMLRQILDNLLAFSFGEEDLMSQFRSMKRGAPSFNKNLKIQQDLKQQFTHVDDSLFAMSLRNPKIAEGITKEVGNVHYNVDKSLETFVEANFPKGISHQQYAISASNKLADYLADVLTNMQMQMSGSGKGKPKKGSGKGEMQLPDIIKKQAQLGEKAKEGAGKKPGEGKKSGEEKGQGEGKGEGEGEGKGEGKDGKGKDGKGKDGKGKDGKDGKGKDGKSGNGEGKGDGENSQDGEGNAKAIMEIYKEQQQLREALQEELKKRGIGGQGQNAVNQMKDIEKQLLNKGFKNEVLQKILNVKQELLKLDKAIQEQGQEEKRQSTTNKKEFNNSAAPLPSALKDYLKSIEILNRQSLPLRTIYNQKVQEYFKQND